MFNLGFMHVRGLGSVPQNYTAAREHFLDAAAKQLPTALNGLGVLHFHGQGMPVDYAEAKRYFEMAALQDHDAAYNLATIYQVLHPLLFPFLHLCIAHALGLLWVAHTPM